MLNLSSQFVVLAFANPGDTLAIIVALYGLVGVTAALLRDAIISPTLHIDKIWGQVLQSHIVVMQDPIPYSTPYSFS
jgi:hypothetical protein